jgi:hypothetical protein
VLGMATEIDERGPCPVGAAVQVKAVVAESGPQVVHVVDRRSRVVLRDVRAGAKLARAAGDVRPRLELLEVALQVARFCLFVKQLIRAIGAAQIDEEEVALFARVRELRGDPRRAVSRGLTRKNARASVARRGPGAATVEADRDLRPFRVSRFSVMSKVPHRGGSAGNLSRLDPQPRPGGVRRRDD